MTDFRPPALTAAFAILAGASQAQDSTRTSVDWPGYYRAAAPCRGCAGRDAWVRLNDAGGKLFVEIVESRAGARPHTRRFAGAGHWRKDGSIIDADGKSGRRSLFVGENFLVLAAPGTQPKGDGAPVLRKQDVYAGSGQQLLVDAATLRKMDGDRRAFEGLINFEHRAEGGHKSLMARFLVACGAKLYSMPRVGYFAGDFATGKLIYSTPKNDNPPQPFATGDDVMAQAAKAYCGG
jgi:hypothetical protein